LKIFDIPDQCLRYSIGNVQALSKLLANILNPNYPIGAFWSIDLKTYSGADGDIQVKAYKGFTHFFFSQ
jgi:hypothetical protein